MGKETTVEMAGTPEYAEAERAFAVCDSSGSGKLDKKQLGKFLRTMGLTPPISTTKGLPDSRDLAGAWQCYERQKHEPVTAENLEDLFQVFDPNKTGQIKFEELANCLAIFGGEEAFSAEELEQLKAVAEIDDNAGGVFNYKEFQELMISTQQPHTTGSVDQGEWPGMKNVQ